MPAFVTVEIPRADGDVLRVDDAAALAEVFFATEVSSLGAGSYDARTLTTHPEQVDREDVTVLNRSFRAMIMKTQLWRPLMEVGDLPWLVALGRDWDLVTMPADEWEDLEVIDRITEAIEAVVSVKGRGVAQATKLLHLKRPRLVPVIDSFVARALGAPLSTEASAAVRVAQARRIVEHFRTAADQVRPQVEQVAAHLQVAGIERSLMRILDALIWCSEAEAWVELAGILERWRRS